MDRIDFRLHMPVLIRPAEDDETPLSESEQWVAIREGHRKPDKALDVAHALGDHTWDNEPETGETWV